MSPRQVRWSTTLSILFAPGLIFALLRISHVRVEDVAALAMRADPFACLALVGATSLHILLSAEKWRLVETVLANSAPARSSAFAYSAIGTAFGQFLPIQLANAASRGLGNRFHAHRNGARGAMASLWEQMFDLWVVLVLAAPAAVTLAYRQPSFMALALPASLLGGLALRPAAFHLGAIAERGSSGRIERFAAQIAGTGLLDGALMMRLYLLSLLRLAILWLMAVLVTVATSVPVQALDLAAALPFAVLASVLSMLPAGLGANELSFTAVLAHLGTPLHDAASWALVNRLLVAEASIVIGLCSLVLLRARRAPAAAG